MSISFHCQACGAAIEVNDEHAGWECDCPSCGATVAIPRSDGRPTSEDTAGTAVAAVSALALIVAALWLQHCCKSPPQDPAERGEGAET